MIYDRDGAPFRTSEELIPAKRWEAWRQGWIDMRYIDLVRKNPDKTLANQIDTLAEWVLQEPKDYTRADQARKKLQKLVKDSK